ncbi:glucosyl-3-phosphoglycerate synthase [Nocardia otitidiscaviarum]|uniref:Glucosyl-3-phosphoglycerate synthase n=1 Tax=Nocardia otitidiscaviarum TaxID=1823 RepID=A0A378Y8W0_9NOCA|nr:glucosyl-3-phosphoglycerate synthase [Nocardia otitidiscaviarum]MBF6131632.1 glucosyl-3-phosphoglycerate synthase [Nocardia otitidiscaviarum]MBF6238286.1 glucosyl-3-phosphoglycerate synthase [Nocardia otitidiscaviarum]MBF6482764.1 glucosyl-3-phosphoglycerate synthase [Nocardia otitidiscaviarum]SUA73278.1 putative glucosyl-3-phosphoglycerate synthase [Nocardia otitidiscaviarum]
MTGLFAKSDEGIRTWANPGWTARDLIAAKDGRTVSVVLPALNEEATVGEVVRAVRRLPAGLVDELIVMDSGSTDATMRVAAEAGATVVSRESVLPDHPPVPGKGEVLWRSLAVASGDIVMFMDSDLIDPDPQFVPKLIGPLLLDPALVFCKGYYRRPLLVGESFDESGGGRVTELVARPLLAALRPGLRHVVQPLGGEYAATRQALERLAFAPHYGVEIGLLIDVFDQYGAEGIGQVDLGVRKHRNRPLHELGVMSRQIVATALGRCGLPDSGAGIVQFPLGVDGFVPREFDLHAQQRPPIGSLLKIAS